MKKFCKHSVNFENELYIPKPIPKMFSIEDVEILKCEVELYLTEFFFFQQ